jgi:hypothetical protein
MLKETFRMLAGSFDKYDVGGSGARPLFGSPGRPFDPGAKRTEPVGLD